MGSETNTRPRAPGCTVEMIINISDFNETDFTKDEKLHCSAVILSSPHGKSNVKIPFLFFGSSSSSGFSDGDTTTIPIRNHVAKN